MTEPSHTESLVCLGVRGHNNLGPPVPGVVVCWQHAPLHGPNESAWNALVADNPFGSALVVEWVNGNRLVDVNDPRPAGDGD